jgi:hypothetical protein
MGKVAVLRRVRRCIGSFLSNSPGLFLAGTANLTEERYCREETARGAILDLIPISNGYSFEGSFIGGLGGTDSGFSFEFHDTVNSFMASGSSFPGTGEDIVDFHNYTGRITQFSVPESGKTALLLVVSLIPIVAVQIRRLLVG